MISSTVTIADATLASSQQCCDRAKRHQSHVSIADATLASSQRHFCHLHIGDKEVSIADATLASSQHVTLFDVSRVTTSFNRRRDACFLATIRANIRASHSSMFQSQTRRLLPRNTSCI